MAVELRVDTHVHSAAAPLKCYTRDQPLFELPLNTFALRVDIPAVFHSPAAAGLARERARRQRAKPVDQPPASSGVVCANSSARFHFFSLPRHRRTCGTFNFEASNPTTGTPLYFLQMPVKHADPWLPHADRTRDLQPPVRLRNGLAQSLLSPLPAVSFYLLCAILPMSGSSRAKQAERGRHWPQHRKQLHHAAQICGPGLGCGAG